MMNWLNGHTKATNQAKVSNRQLEAESLPSFSRVERWKIGETLFMFCVFVFPSKKLMKSITRKKYIHTFCILHSSANSLDSWQKIFRNSFCLLWTLTSCICINTGLLIDLLQTKFWLYISKPSTQMMFTHCKRKKTLYVFDLVWLTSW